MHTPAINPQRPEGLPPHCTASRLSGIGLRLLLASLTCGLATTPTHAGLPEPDALVYGTIALDGQAVTAADTHLVIEARHEANGPVVATTNMGAEPAAGNFYVLRIPMESGLPLTSPLTAVVGDTLELCVVEAGTVVAETFFTISARAQTQRVDLGTPVPDADADTLPDAWETAYFGVLDYGPASVGLNGGTLLNNYVAGTDPNQEGSAFAVTIDSGETSVLVSFSTRRAEGPGYEGLTRYYTLRTSSDLEDGWEDVEGYTGLPGDNADVLYPQASDGQPEFYRVLVWLE